MTDPSGFTIYVPAIPKTMPKKNNPAPPANNNITEKEKPKEAKKPPQLDIDQQKALMYNHLRLGNHSFSEGKYANALRHFETASAAVPLEALPLFHMAEAYIATAQYPKAAMCVQKGLRWMPRWVTADFSPELLYADRVEDRKKHMKALEDFAKKNPHDDSILFLLAYQYWFNNQKEEAVKTFKRASTLAMDTTLIDLFLKAKVEQAATEKEKEKAKEPEKNLPPTPLPK